MRAILDGVLVDWVGLLVHRLGEEKNRLVFRSVGEGWTVKSTVSLFNKIIVLIEGLNRTADWKVGTKKYSKQKGILSKDKSIGGLPDSDDESDMARDQRTAAAAEEARRLAAEPQAVVQEETAEETPAVMEKTTEEAVAVVRSPQRRTRRRLVKASDKAAAEVSSSQASDEESDEDNQFILQRRTRSRSMVSGSSGSTEL